MNAYYEFMDNQINNFIDVTVGFSNLLSSQLYTFDQKTLKHFFDQYHLIKEFQNITLSLFNASIHGDFDPELASLVLNDVPEEQGWEYHKKLTPQQHKTPVFFRTDEVALGKISEIQCPGSSWGLYEQLYSFYTHYSSVFGEIASFLQPLSQQFSTALRQWLGREPVIHHLLDNASIPHGMRYFLQRTRRHHLKYYSYDKDITPYDCNFIRAHDFIGLFTHNFAKHRLVESNKDLVQYDLPPSVLFDVKVGLIFPFWQKTRAYYSNAIRNIFPYTRLITPEGFTLEDGTKVSIEKFCKLSQKNRNYYIKYAGSDISLNWGSKGVYYAGSLSGVKCQEILEEIAKDYSKKRYWIIQKGCRSNDRATCITRDSDELTTTNVYSKISNFYGPNGLMGTLVMQRFFPKVHGATDTIVSIGR